MKSNDRINRIFHVYMIKCALQGDEIGIWKCWFFVERGKPENPEKNLSEQRREPTTNSTHI